MKLIKKNKVRLPRKQKKNSITIGESLIALVNKKYRVMSPRKKLQLNKRFIQTFKP